MKLRFNIKAYAKAAWLKLHGIHDAPQAVAGGAAIGIFWGFTPLTGFKTLLSILFAWMFRCSKIPAVIAFTFHDVLLPVWPVVLRWEYQVGYWILNHHLPPKVAINKLHLAELFHWKTINLLGPTFLGACVFGIPAALGSYWLVLRSGCRFPGWQAKALAAV